MAGDGAAAAFGSGAAFTGDPAGFAATGFAAAATFCATGALAVTGLTGEADFEGAALLDDFAAVAILEGGAMDVRGWVVLETVACFCAGMTAVFTGEGEGADFLDAELWLDAGF